MRGNGLVVVLFFDFLFCFAIFFTVLLVASTIC